jgi:hypothetical protein
MKRINRLRLARLQELSICHDDKLHTSTYTSIFPKCFKNNCKNHDIDFNKVCLCSVISSAKSNTFCRIHPKKFYQYKWEKLPRFILKVIIKCQRIIRKFLFKKIINRRSLIKKAKGKLPTDLYDYIFTFLPIMRPNINKDFIDMEEYYMCCRDSQKNGYYRYLWAVRSMSYQSTTMFHQPIITNATVTYLPQ